MAARKQEQINDILTRGVTEAIVKRNLEKRLKSGAKLRVKLGIDATRPKLHLGHAVALLKLRALQALGHKVVFIIGDFTGQIGDPSDKERERPMLTEDQVFKNMKRYREQAGLVLDMDKVEVRYNSEWHNNIVQKQMLTLASRFTVSQMVERENFAKRLKAGKAVWLHELYYPILQGYDSVMVKADVELGGNDQLFNLLAGRQIQEFYKQPPQDIMTVQLLTGTDGRKMSASYDNAVWLDDSGEQMYGRLMSINDALISQYLWLCTTHDSKEITEIERELKRGANPRDAKARLALAITQFYRGEKEASAAAENFTRVFTKKQAPESMPTIRIAGKTLPLIDLVKKTKLVASRSEARRLIEQGGVMINQKSLTDWKATVTPKKGMVIKIGKRRFVKIG